MSENILSVFIDESGDFGPFEHYAPYYIVSMILHEQSTDISDNIAVLDAHVRNLNCEQHVIHVGPLIRREQNYCNDQMEDRKRLLMHFLILQGNYLFRIFVRRLKKANVRMWLS